MNKLPLDPKIWLLLAPIIVIQYGLMIFCLIRLVRAHKLNYLNKPIWALIILLGQLIGSVLFLILESGQNEGD